MKKCKTCTYFERGIWPDETEQCGGSCKVLQAILEMDNFLYNTLYIQDTFGCILHKEK